MDMSLVNQMRMMYVYGFDIVRDSIDGMKSTKWG